MAALGCGRSEEKKKSEPSIATPSPSSQQTALTPTQQQLVNAAVADDRFKRGMCLPAIKEQLHALAKQVPANEQLSDAASASLAACEDWETLSDHLRQRLALSPSDSLLRRIAEVEIKAQRYELAVDVILPLARRTDANPEASLLAGLSLYFAGRGGEARPYLEKVEPAMTARGEINPLETLGLIALEESRLEDARRMFTKAIATAPSTILARHGLGRTLARLGDASGAADQFAQARALQDTFTANETRQFRLSAMSKDVQAAIDAKDTQRAIKLLDQMIVIADAKMRTQLEQFRAGLVAQP